MTPREIAREIAELTSTPLMAAAFVHHMVDLGVDPEGLDQHALLAIWQAYEGIDIDCRTEPLPFVWDSLLALIGVIMDKWAIERRAQEEQRRIREGLLAERVGDRQGIVSLPQGAQAALARLLKSNRHRGGST